MTAPIPVDAVVVEHPLARAYRAADAFADSKSSKNTRAAYRLDLTGCSRPLGKCEPPHRHLEVAWLPWCAANGVDPLGDHARPAVLLKWLTALENAGQSEPTRARRLAAVSGWYSYLERNGAVTRNPAAALTKDERPRSSGQIHYVSPTAAPDRKQAAALLAAADDDGPRTAAIVGVLMFTGMRVSAAVDADESDLEMLRGHHVLRVTLKGGRTTIEPLPAPAWSRLEAYLNTRPAEPNLPALAAGATPARPLFARATGRRVTRQEVYRLLRRIAVKAGLGDIARLSPHSLRKAYISDLLEEGVPLRDVQLAVGHADPRTTERYDQRRMSPDKHPSYRRAAQLADSSADGGHLPESP